MRKIAADYMISGGVKVANPLIKVGEDGTILSVGTFEKGSLDDSVERFEGLLIPGLVNAHSHVEYSFVEGRIAEGGGLPRFIESIIETKYKSNVTVEERAAAAVKIDEAMSREGIVAVGDHNNNDYVYALKEQSSVYYHSFVELYDVDNQDDDTTFEQGLARQAEHTSRGLVASVVPHACYTLSDGLLGRCGGALSSAKGAKAEGVLSVHYKESVVMGGDSESDRVFAALSPERSSILVHAIYATKEDIDRAQALLGDKLTVALCPLSNYYIESRMADVEMLRRKGVRLALGTDSLSSNRVISMVAEIEKMQEVYPALDLTEIVDYATINGARALEIDSWAGTIEVGKRPGLVNIAQFDGERLSAQSQGVRIA